MEKSRTSIVNWPPVCLYANHSKWVAKRETISWISSLFTLVPTPTYLVLSFSSLKMWDGIGYLKFHSKFFWNMPGKLAILWQWLLRTFFNCLRKDCRWLHVAGCERDFFVFLTQNHTVRFSQAFDNISTCTFERYRKAN